MHLEDDHSHIIISILDEVDHFLRDLKPGIGLGKIDDHPKVNLLEKEILNCLKRPNSVSQICMIFESGTRTQVNLSEEYLPNICKLLKFTPGSCVAFAFCLCQSQFKPYNIEAIKLLKQKLPDVIPSGTLSDIPEDILHGVIQSIFSTDELQSPEISGNFLNGLKLLAQQSSSYGSILGVGAKQNTMQPNERDLMNLQKMTDNSRQRMSVASILDEFGTQCATNSDIFRKTLQSIGIKIDEEQLAGIIVNILPRPIPSASDSEEKKLEISNPWNLEVIAEVLSQECRGLNWVNVTKCLDMPNLVIRSETDFTLLTRIFVRIAGTAMPAIGILAPWNNRNAQLAMLTLGANSPRNIVDFTSFVSPDQLIPGEIPTPPNLSWLCLPIYTRFFELANNGMQHEVLEILSKAAGTYPEYFLISLSQVQDPNGGIRAELLRRLLPSFTGLQGTRPTSLVVMRKLCSTNIDLLILLCRIACKKAKKVWEVANIDNLLKSIPGNITRKLEEEATIDELLSLWCLRTDHLEMSLEEKLSKSLEQNSKNGRLFIGFIKLHADTLRPRSSPGDGILSFDSYATILRMLQSVPQVVPIEELRMLVAHYQQSLQLQQQQMQQQFAKSQQQPSHVSLNDAIENNSGVVDGEFARLPPGPDTEEVEALANAYFQKIYTADISIADIIVLLKQFKSSNEKKEQEIFRCMIHNLYDEYRFFHKYPEKELQVTGRLFGALIQNQLVSSITLGIALRYVLESLRKDPEQSNGIDKMFLFGKVALEQFRSRLSEWPQYCSHLLQIPHFQRYCPELYLEVQKALNGPQPVQQQQQQSMVQPPPLQQQSQLQSHQILNMDLQSQNQHLGGNNMLSEPVNMLSQQLMNMNVSQMDGSSKRVSAFENVNNSQSNPSQTPTVLLSPFSQQQPQHVMSPPPVTSIPPPVATPQQTQLEPEPVPELPTRASYEIDRMGLVNVDVLNTTMPPENIRDQIIFIINNIAKNNFETKSNEIKEILNADHFNWFANYLVVKRISTQPNLHPLYLSVLDALEQNSLQKLVLDSAYHNVTKLLQSPNITTSSSERSLLRNLGTWLGQMTIARNKPLLQKRINLKQLLFWGFETGRLIAVCSFVAKIVEGVKDSKVFRPPNPWLMALLGIMRELYEIEDLKLNIKFEVQVLCKNINIKIEDIPKGNALSQCRLPVKDQRNPDFNFKPNANTATGQTQVASASPVVSQPSPPMTSIPLPPALTAANLPGTAVAPSTGKMIAEENDDSKSISNTNTSGAPVAVDATQAALANLASSITINPSLQYFVTNPNQRRLVLIAVDRGIREIIQSAVERSVTIAATTTKYLITKDFYMEPNEQTLRSGAHWMVSSLAGSLALATCKEPLRISIGNHLRTLLAQSISDQNVIEQIVQVCSNENVDIGAALIEKAAIDKSIREIDEVFASSMQTRATFRESGHTFVDPSVQLSGKYPAELQDVLKPRLGGLLPHQLQMYEAFKRLKLIPPPSPVALQDTPTASPLLTGMNASMGIDSKALPPPGPQQPAGQQLSMSQALEGYQLVLSRIDASLKAVQIQAQGRDITIGMLGSDHDILVLLRDLILITQRTQATARLETAMTFSENVFKRMFDSSASPDVLRGEVYVTILEAIRDACGGSKVFAPEFVAWLGNYAAYVNNDETSRKMYRLILPLLLRAKLIRAQEVDSFFATYMDGGRNLFWLELAVSFTKQCLTEGLSTIYDFARTIDTVNKMRPTNLVLKKQLQMWLADIKGLSKTQEDLKSASTAAVAVTSAGPPPPLSTPNNVGNLLGTLSAPPNQRDAAIREHVTFLLERWLRIWQGINDALFSQYLQLMHQYGVLKTEDAADKFFRIATEICCEICLKGNPSTDQQAVSTLNYTILDALSRLFLLLFRLADKQEAGSDMNVRVNLLNRILSAIARTLLDDHDNKKITKTAFDQRPYYRLLSNLSNDMNVPDAKQEQNPYLYPLLAAHSQVYMALQPNIAPGFAFAWLQLISKRSFMPHLLLVKGMKAWPNMHRLLTALLGFLQPFLKAAQLNESIRKLYKGTLRLLLVLLHDFPEFLCDYHLSFCDIIPMNCVQLRNLILSAFPRSMRLPDPFTPNLKIDSLPEIIQAPRILSDYLGPIAGIKVLLDNYMTNKLPAELPSKLPTILASNNGNYNLPLITSLVVYIGSLAIVQLQNKIPLQNSAGLEIFKQLTSVSVDAECRYIVFNTIANQLRYPNSHTHYFSALILSLFADAESEFLQEQITRVLLERLIVHRPHPWGLLITFIELIKNPKYSFWRKGFTRSAPEMERVFESIARSCIGASASTVIHQQLNGNTQNGGANL
eukprot:gene9842-13237_t